MAVNADKPHLWKQDIAASVDLYNDWFMRFAPEAYKTARLEATDEVRQAMIWTRDMRDIVPNLLISYPSMLPMLRMATVPPLARDRLIGLAKISPTLIRRMELNRSVPSTMPLEKVLPELTRAVTVIQKLLDTDIFPWLRNNQEPTEIERERAATIVADRLCGAMANPIIRNTQEQRQLSHVAEYLQKRGYRQAEAGERTMFLNMPDKTFSFRMNVPVHLGGERNVRIPVDIVIQPARTTEKASRFPLLVEAKSAGDFTNVNKRRKEEATKMNQLRDTYGQDIHFVLFLCGYFDSGYLGYEAAEGIDWVWEHRIDDLAHFGV